MVRRMGGAVAHRAGGKFTLAQGAIHGWTERDEEREAVILRLIGQLDHVMATE